jgi:hypothetical protein
MQGYISDVAGYDDFSSGSNRVAALVAAWVKCPGAVLRPWVCSNARHSVKYEPRPRFHSDSRSPLPETNDFSGFPELLNGTDIIASTPRNHCLHNTSAEGPVLNG